MVNNGVASHECEFGCRGERERVGVLFAQLGTPDAPTAPALKKYLKEFLGDPRVIEANRILWWFILNGIILNTRPKRSAALYKRIWTEEGSPLLATTVSFTKKIAAQFPKLDIQFGMRYGSPSLASVIDGMLERGCRKILLFPLYPQYAAATTASTYDAVFSHLLKNRFVPSLKVVAPFYKNEGYIASLAKIINSTMEQRGTPERLVLSYHGIPERYVTAGDPYCCMCTETTEALKPHLKIAPEKVMHTYQSRFGKEPWLVPYTDVTLDELASQGVKEVMVALPGFTADCLETLDEIGHEGKKMFIEKGGRDLILIPCLNDDDHWISSVAHMVKLELGDWMDQPSCNAPLACPVQCAKRAGAVP